MSDLKSVRLNDIEYGVRAGLAAVEALRTWVKGSEAYRICEDRERALKDAEKALSALSSNWSRIQSVMAAKDRQYDAYVTRGYDDEPQSCSCHLSAPCSWCASQPDEEEPEPA